MLEIRVRAVNDNGTVGEGSRVIPTSSITLTVIDGAASTLKFSAPASEFAPHAMPFVVRVEYANGGRFAKLPERDLYIVESDADDSKDPAEIVNYSATEFVPWLLAGAYVGTGQFEKDGERTIDGDGLGRISAGHLLQYFIDEAKGRGWLAPLTYDFTPWKDSNGTDWTLDDREKIAWRLETFYSAVLDKITEQGMCEWSTVGRMLRLFRTGTHGVDVSAEVVLGGRGFDRVPVKTDTSGWFTHVLGLSDAGRVHVQNTALEARFGRRSAVMSQTGVKDSAASTRLANELLAKAANVAREEAYEWTPGDLDLYPWRDFNIGDVVSARSRGAKRQRRVVGLIVRQASGVATVQARVGEKVSTLAARTNARAAAAVTGNVIGGSGGTFATAPPLPSDEPLAPVGVFIAANSGEWGADRTARSRVSISWSAVTEATNSAEVDVSHYEVYSRTAAGPLALDTSTAETSVEVETWRPGELRIVQVRAVSTKGRASGYSTELAVTPAVPGEIVPLAPAGLTVASNVATFTEAGPVATVSITFPAVTHAVGGGEVDVAEYELLVDGNPTTRSTAAGFSVKLASGVAAEYRVRAISDLGEIGDASDPLIVTGATPAAATRAPSAPTLVTGSGLVVARWDGLYVSGGTSGAHAVMLERKDGTSWVREGAALTGAGSWTVRGVIGSTMTVRLVAYDAIGQETGVSAEGSIVVASLQRPDIDPDVLVELAPAVVKINSSRGTAFKNSEIATDLTVTVFSGTQTVTTLTELHALFGTGAFLEWWWRRLDDTAEGVISSADPRISQGGFKLTVSPADVDVQTVFKCILHT